MFGLKRCVNSARTVVEVVQKGLGLFLVISKNAGFLLVRTWSWGRSKNYRLLVYHGSFGWWHAWSEFPVCFLIYFIDFLVTLGFSIRVLSGFCSLGLSPWIFSIFSAKLDYLLVSLILACGCGGVVCR